MKNRCENSTAAGVGQEREIKKKFSRSAGHLGGRERTKQESRPPHRRRRSVCECAYHVVHKSCGKKKKKKGDNRTTARWDFERPCDNSNYDVYSSGIVSGNAMVRGSMYRKKKKNLYDMIRVRIETTMFYYILNNVTQLHTGVILFLRYYFSCQGSHRDRFSLNYPCMRIHNIYLLYTGAECVARCAYTARFLTSMCTVIREKEDSEKILKYRIRMNKKKKN